MDYYAFHFPLEGEIKEGDFVQDSLEQFFKVVKIDEQSYDVLCLSEMKTKKLKFKREDLHKVTPLVLYSNHINPGDKNILSYVSRNRKVLSVVSDLILTKLINNGTRAVLESKDGKISVTEDYPFKVFLNELHGIAHLTVKIIGIISPDATPFINAGDRVEEFEVMSNNSDWRNNIIKVKCPWGCYH